ncbi:MAG: hypothetical protein JW795_08910 [Chitinivibrionales bacterium]|nr:hypothetical protein [Chitinivibrionales bacterium]
MRMLVQRITPGLLTSLIVGMLFCISCDFNSPSEPKPKINQKIMEIIEPLSGDTISLINKSKLIVRYNPGPVDAPFDRYFSTDGGKTWKSMTVEVINRVIVESTDASVKYRHEVMVWLPEVDGLKNGDQIYIKVNSYGNSPYDDKIGPVTVEE